ncbi:class I SAM-dependent methyltransferase [Robbsia sp. KACC 23696]|uniref:class I SAM-dependent methyltransferase n=1 Tax=Robbsia sp. KACC 23696 TaxID=3149231 RepID=UPI00325BAD36
MPTPIDMLLDRLHTQSNAESVQRARARFNGTDHEFSAIVEHYFALSPSLRQRFLSEHGVLLADDTTSMQGTPMSLAISAEMGRFLRNMVLAQRGSRILELGSSYGVSTLYLADAVRSLGSGKVIATERDPRKCAGLRENLDMAGLTDYVDLREGDIFDTVLDLHGSFDIIFIDAWADAYLPLFQQIERLLSPGTIVLTDNMYSAEETVAGYRDYLHHHPRLSSSTMDFASGVEFTVVVR